MKKMKIAYNSAYDQIETFNFTFAEQAIVVCFYLCSNFQEIAMLIATIPTADESSHSAMGTLHPHHSATSVLYITICCLMFSLQKINTPFPN